jgi:hypothetical protein
MNAYRYIYNNSKYLIMESNNISEINKLLSLKKNYYDFLLDKSNQELMIKNNILSDTFLTNLLSNITNYTEITNEYSNHDNEYIFRSYPKGNYLNLMINNLAKCIENKQFIFKFFNLEGYKDLTQKNIEIIDMSIIDIDNVAETFGHLKERGLLTLLALRETPGSLNYIPPDINLLIEKFKEPHTKDTSNLKNKKAKPSILSVGARALSKHTHRSSDGFWPKGNGKEVEKNIQAEEILNRIISECVWINIHGLPGDIPILELRIEAGYGARWQVDGEFRGFLEPPMEDGHSKGWKH